MAVKKVDRKLARLEPLYKARDLFNYILTLTHPAEYDKDGKRTRRSGILGEGQPLQVFGYDIITCGKRFMPTVRLALFKGVEIKQCIFC